MAVTIRSVLASSGGGGSIKDAYRAKVNETGLTTYIPTPYENRCTINEGKIAVDSANNTVYIYLDFTITTTMGSSDYYQVLTLVGLISSNLPLRMNTSTRGEETLSTDESSSIPSKSWFAWARSSTNLALSVRRSKGFIEGEHYIVYGSWQY